MLSNNIICPSIRSSIGSHLPWSGIGRMPRICCRRPMRNCGAVVKNSCLDFLRAAQRHGTEDEDLFERYEMAASPSPQQRLEEQEQVQQVKRIIRRLPAAQRQVICLRGLQDYSLEEIGELTGFSAANVRTLLSRARKTIREQFQKWYAI